MKHLEGLFEELKIEVEKASSCDKYVGVVFVHPDDVESVSRFIWSLRSSEYNTQKKTFKFEEGGILKIGTLKRENTYRFPQHDYAGYELTTILIQDQCFGKYHRGEYKKVNEITSRCGGNQDFIMYMLSRSHTDSKFPARFVYV